jgi:hypothetical protein
VARENIMVKGYHRGNSYSPHGLQEAEKRTGRSQDKILFECMPPMTYFLQSSPTSQTFHHLPKWHHPPGTKFSTHEPMGDTSYSTHNNQVMGYPFSYFVHYLNDNINIYLH